MSCLRNDIVLLPVPFTDLTSRKVRPAVVLGCVGRHADLILLPISSQLQNTDYELRDWRAAGLNVRCGIKAQLATVESRLVRKVVGRLSDADRFEVDKHLREWLGL